MEIIQKPDSLSLLGNLKKFLISSNAEVDFSLSVSIDGADVSLLQESYTPDSSGNISIDIREVCGQYLKTNLPSDNVFLQSDALRTFTATIGSSSWSFTVVNASVRNLTLTALEYLQYNFLTLQPQSKQVSWHSPEYLTYYFTEQADVQAKFYLKSGGTETVTVATISPTPEGGSGTIQLVNKVYTINTSLSRLMALSSHDTEDLQGIVDVWVQGSVSRLSYIQRYVYAPSTGEEHHYFAVNSLGGIDTFTFIGEQKITGEIEHQAAENDDKKITVTSGGQRKYRQNTGYLGEASSEWLWEFLHSSRQWAVAGAAAEELVVVSSSLSQGDLTNLNSSSFDFLLARDGGLLPESRRDETFPDITVPSPVSDLFFLNPRIIDFPAAPSDAELVFPVQTPYSNEWSYLTLQELQERLSIAASLNHTHRNLSVLQALGESNGQLTYRGVVIGSGGGISLPIAISDVEGLSSILNSKANVSHSHRWADITDRPTRLTDFTNNLVPSWALAIEKPSYNFSEIQNKPTTLSGYGITDGYSSFSTTGSGNAITDVSGSGHALTFTKGNTFVDLASEQTISGKKHISYLDVTGAFAVPQVEPSAEAGKVFEYIDHSGSFGEVASAVTPADLKDLTLKINGVVKTTYNPSSAASFNVDLTSYATQSWVEAKNYLQGITKAMVEAVLTGNITSHTHSQYLTSHQSLADYALKSEIPTSMAWSAITGRPSKLSDFTNDLISSWALAATKPSYSWSEITSRPTALSAFSGDSTHRLVTDTQITNWNSAYGWGNHADAGYLTSFTETDPTVPAWAKATSKPSYTWSEIGSRPTKLSQFTNDIISSWALSATKPSYSWNEITSKPTTISGYGINSLPEAYLTWGGKNYSASYGPIDAAMVGDLGANRFAFGSVSAIEIYYSRNNGVTWIDYESSDAGKKKLVSGLSASYAIGKAASNDVANANYQLRIRIGTGIGLYTVLNKFIIFVGTNGTTGNWCTIRKRLKTDQTAGNEVWTNVVTQVGIGGWSGWNVINTAGITFGNGSGQYGQIEFTFGCTGYNGNGTTNAGLTVYKLLAFGGMGWTTPSNLARFNHLYDYDENQNMWMPAGILPKADNVSSHTLGSSSKRWSAVYATNLYGNLAWTNIQNKPTTLSGYGITDGYSSLTTSGSGNAITAVSGTGHSLTFTKGNTFVDLANEQTISGRKHISYLDVTGALAIPQVEPTAESGKVFEYIDNSGSFGEAASAVTPADLKDLTLKINGVVKTTYNPSSAASFNVDLTSYATQSWVEAKNYLQGITKAMVEAVLTGNITSHTHSQYLTSHQSLADYALKSEIPTSMAWSAITGRPSKLSDFTNDLISSWALAATKPSYSWSEITSRPNALSAFSGDSTHRLVTDTQITNWNSAYGWGNHADAGYLTSFTETDPTVPAWAKAASKPSYSWSEISSKPTSLSGYGISDATSKTEAIPYIVGPSTDTTAGTWTGTYEGITAYTDGLTIIYVPAVAGASTTTLNINGLGAKTCYFSNTSKLTTHYSAGTPILFTYRGGYWRRADYNTNSDTLLRVYRQTSGYNDDYPILVSRTKSIGTAGSNSSYTAVYGVVYDTTQQPTVNPYSGEFKALKVTATTLQGSLAWSYINGKPTSLSDFTNDMISSWALAASKPAYTLDEVSDGSTRKLSDYMLSSSFTKSAIITLLGNDTFAPYNSNGYLPLNGGTLTGGLLLQANQTFDVSTAARSIYYTDSNNVSRRAMIMNPNGVLAIGYDLPSAQLNLQLDGYSTLLRFGSTKNYSLTLNGADGTIRSSVGANLVSLGYRSGNTIYPFKHIYSTFNVSTKCIGAISGTVLYGVARFTIANTKKARTFAIKIPSGTNATTFKIIIYSSYNTCPSSTITVSTGGVNLTSSAYCALYPSYSVEGSFAGRVAFARDGNTSDSHMYILLGCYNDGQQYQSGMIAIDSIIHSSGASVADTVMNFGYELLDLDSESMFTKITECVNADAHFKSVSVTEHVTAPKIDCTNMFLVPTSEPSSVPAGKVAEYIDINSGSFAN